MKGIDIDMGGGREAMGNEKKMMVHGVEYASIRAAARAHGIAPATAQRRLKEGMSPDRAFTERPMSRSEAGRRGKEAGPWINRR